jgi:hypothetical protein
MPDRLAPFDSDDPKCPKCGLAVEAVAANEGSFFLTCDNKIPQQGRFPERCGQTVHVIAFEGVAIVTPVTKADFQIFRRSYPTGRPGLQKARDPPDAAATIHPPRSRSSACLDCGVRDATLPAARGRLPETAS